MAASIGALFWTSAAAADLTSEWRDLQARCGAAVARGAALDLSGLRERAPDFAYNRDVTDGTRRYLAPGAATVGGRLVPRNFEAPDGALRLRLIEYRTRPGTRAICEIVPRRALTGDEARTLLDAYRDMMRAALAQGDWQRADLRSDATVIREGMTATEPNARACPVIASVTVRPAEGDFRSSVSEMAGAPECGGASLLDRPAPRRPGEDT
ncbi:hypothetical protein [Jannaschia formosa]|uniref:hypothetical protein n=1 Tax=Jannaschia formosa TaxID=2259592 RepID=UPI000E1BB515|nr:hypothetical protein [Jannaschia formosa]TFL18993.1 hypothetical protein DR046_06155 [Jannaschia formosa]